MTLSRYAYLVSALLLTCGAAAQAAPAQATSACASEPAASRAACVRETGAAAQAAREGALTTASAATYERNALARCEVFKAPQDQADCRARMGPQAIVSGSVDGGGLLREEVQTRIVTR
ncbi:MAG: hypothetical protein OZ923_12140 [Comamonadaceae bacterium]|nr:hypothetical protein [Burkholderiales bacterium]MEB2349346.1 hypothetical protein [Comamonadaceae bacterium]